MASGDPVVQVLQVMPPGANAARMDARAGGSTPAENIIVYDFDPAADTYMDFLCKLVGYDDGGLAFTGPWSASSGTSGQVRWRYALRRIADDAEDVDGAHTYDYNEVSDTAPSVNGELSYPTISFTDGADMDNVGDGELFVLRVHRDYDHADDNMAGDAELWGPPIGVES